MQLCLKQSKKKKMRGFEKHFISPTKHRRTCTLMHGEREAVASAGGSGWGGRRCGQGQRHKPASTQVFRHKHCLGGSRCLCWAACGSDGCTDRPMHEGVWWQTDRIAEGLLPYQAGARPLYTILLHPAVRLDWANCRPAALWWGDALCVCQSQIEHVYLGCTAGVVRQVAASKHTCKHKNRGEEPLHLELGQHDPVKASLSGKFYLSFELLFFSLEFKLLLKQQEG